MNPRKESPKRRSPTGGRRLAPFEALSAAEVLERMDEGFYSLDREWRLTYVNKAPNGSGGRGGDNSSARRMFDLSPRFRGSESHAAHERALKTGKLVRVRAISTATGAAVELSIFPIADGLAIYFRDVSAEERIEVELRARSEVLTLAEESAGIGVWDSSSTPDSCVARRSIFGSWGCRRRTAADRGGSQDPPPGGRGFGAAGLRARRSSPAPTPTIPSTASCATAKSRWIFGRGRVVRDPSRQAHPL